MHRLSVIHLLAVASLYSEETLTEKIVKTIPAKMGEAFVRGKGDPMAELEQWREPVVRMLVSCSSEKYYDEYVDLRPRQEFDLPPFRSKIRPTGKRPAERRGARSREQRTRR